MTALNWTELQRCYEELEEQGIFCSPKAADRETAKAQSPQEAWDAARRALWIIGVLERIAEIMGLQECADKMAGWIDDGGEFLLATRRVNYAIDVLQEAAAAVMLPLVRTEHAKSGDELHTFDDSKTEYDTLIDNSDWHKIDAGWL